MLNFTNIVTHFMFIFSPLQAYPLNIIPFHLYWMIWSCASMYVIHVRYIHFCIIFVPLSVHILPNMSFIVQYTVPLITIYFVTMNVYYYSVYEIMVHNELLPFWLKISFKVGPTSCGMYYYMKRIVAFSLLSKKQYWQNCI